MHATTTPIDVRILDEILALQLTVAWAGEALCEPARLGWWRTDLVDAEGGGDLFARLLPRTAPWAALEAALAAAAHVDRAARLRLAQPDTVRTLFSWGFALDEKLAERLAALKQTLTPPSTALPLPLELGAPFSRDAFEHRLRIEGLRVDSVPGGRQVVLHSDAGRLIVPGEQTRTVLGEVAIVQKVGSTFQTLVVNANVLARHLAAALVPVAPHYPAPFVRVGQP